MGLNIRSNSWYADNLSWATVCYALINAFDRLGHNTYVVSTNGLNENAFDDKDKMVKSALALQSFGSGKAQIDIDWTYTPPINFGSRFLPNSKNRAVLYNYETPYWPKEWRKFYHIPDFYFPSSNFSAEIFHINGIPAEKNFVIPHGVDTNIFNSSIPPVKLKTKKSFRFVCVAAPHYRKNLDTLLEAYCRAFDKADDVCMVIKTKVYKHSDGMFDPQNPQKNPNGRKGFEIVIGDLFKKIYKKFGKNMPEIELLEGHVENVSSIYNACQCHVTTTGAEGFGLPLLESQSCGLINIAPRYSGHLDFMNDNNSLLIDTKLRKAKPEEQYWGFDPRSTIGQPSAEHTAELMRKAYEEYDSLIDKFKPEMEKTVKQLSWENAAQLMIDATEGNMPPYEHGTYDLNAHQRVK